MLKCFGIKFKTITYTIYRKRENYMRQKMERRREDKHSKENSGRKKQTKNTSFSEKGVNFTILTLLNMISS